MFFNYFFPNRTKVTREELRTLGLGYVFEPETAASPKSDLCPRGVNNGPGGQHGLIVSLSDEFCGYFKDQQVWKQEIDADYWVGMWTASDKRPTPETLARENMIVGEPLLLDDGHVWMCPKARHWEEFDGELVPYRTLPARLTRDDNGRWFPGEVKEVYRELWRLATELMDTLANGNAVAFTELDNLVIECFQTNYRVSAIELDLLGIHNDIVRNRVPRILLDMDGFDVLLKKKLTTPATGPSTAGPVVLPPAAATDDTIRPAAT